MCATTRLRLAFYFCIFTQPQCRKPSNSMKLNFTECTYPRPKTSLFLNGGSVCFAEVFFLRTHQHTSIVYLVYTKHDSFALYWLLTGACQCSDRLVRGKSFPIWGWNGFSRSWAQMKGSLLQVLLAAQDWACAKGCLEEVFDPLNPIPLSFWNFSMWISLEISRAKVLG